MMPTRSKLGPSKQATDEDASRPRIDGMLGYTYPLQPVSENKAASLGDPIWKRDGFPGQIRGSDSVFEAIRLRPEDQELRTRLGDGTPAGPTSVFNEEIECFRSQACLSDSCEAIFLSPQHLI